jgi:GntR family transcriptional regulator
LTLPPLDRRSVVPLYYQIQQRLLEQIRSASLKAGELVPSEQEISTQLGVSRMTARQALKSLCDLGFTYSQQGKGTFVSAMKLEKNFRQILSFTEEMQARGSKPRSRVLAFEVISATDEVAEALRLKPQESVVSLRRIRTANALPMGIEYSHLPPQLCPGLTEKFNPRSSLYEALQKLYGIQMTVADEVVEAGLANADDSKLLKISRRQPVFLFTRTSYLQSGQPVEYTKSVYRADRYKIVNRLTRVQNELLASVRLV